MSADCRVYIGRFDYQTTERDVEKFFKGYGKLNEVMMKNGFAFVEFSDPRDADDAVHDLSGKDFNGYRVVVDIARGTPHGQDRNRDSDRGYFGGAGWGGGRGRYGGGGGGGRGRGGGGGYGLSDFRTDYRLIVENLSSRVSWQELKDTFRQVSEVTYATAHMKTKNEGILEFASKSDMKKAIREMDGKDMNGRKIRLVEEKRRKSRSRTRSRSRSSRSRSESSRSRSRTPEPRRQKKKRPSRSSRSPSGSPPKTSKTTTSDKKDGERENREEQ